jgi:1-acyl-sn-glycerol-3-phosphate acyltransferase
VRPAKLIILVLLFSGFLATAFIISLGISLFRLPRLRIVSQLMRRFNRILRIFLNVKIDLEGAKDCLSADGRFIVSNHLGYLDGIVLGSLFPVIFVTKRQVKRWPVIGQLLALLGTIFVDRETNRTFFESSTEFPARSGKEQMSSYSPRAPLPTVRSCSLFSRHFSPLH